MSTIHAGLTALENALHEKKAWLDEINKRHVDLTSKLVDNRIAAKRLRKEVAEITNLIGELQ